MMIDMEALTDDQKFALAIIAGCEIVVEPDPMDPLAFRFRTKDKVGFRNDQDGEIRVVISKSAAMKVVG